MDNDENDNNNNDEYLSIEKPQLSNVEKRDLFGALEHLIIVGNYQRLQHWRQSEFQRRMIPIELKDFRAVHAQDVRIYNLPHEIGLDLTDMQKTWPRQTQPHKHIDQQWDLELSDGIDSLKFTKQRLSLFQGHGNIKSSSSSSSSLVNNKATSTFLVHCWERAMHATSSTVITNANANSNNNIHTRQTPKTTATVQELCQKYQILEPTNERPFRCPTRCCGDQEREFATWEQLHQHFYGSTPNNLTGCCWKLIHRKRQTIVANILQNEIHSQQKQLLQMILKKDIFINAKGDNHIQDWKDMLAYWEKIMASAYTIYPQTATNAWNHALQVGTDEPSLPINAAVLEAVRNRLIERYAQVPR